MSADPRLIVALDLPDVAAADALVGRLGDAVAFYKIGHEFAYVGGIEFGRRLIAAGKQVFFDLKFHDIPHTVERGVAQIAGMGARFLTVHAYPQTLAAAAKGAAGSTLQVLGVSVLTSMNDDDLARAGYGMGVDDMVRRRARQTYESGCPGFVCGATDLALVRETVGAALTLVTPGIRPAGAALADQKRVMTPIEAIAAGSDYLVVGRPIVAAPDPKAAAEAVLAEMGER